MSIVQFHNFVRSFMCVSNMISNSMNEEHKFKGFENKWPGKCLGLTNI